MHTLFKRPAVLALCAVFLCGCANKPADPAGDADSSDPYEATNRKLFAVNTAIDDNFTHPVASAYVNTVPAPARTHLHDVLSNIGNPTQFANDVLQGKPRKAGNTFMRFLINTTFGIGGVFDVATGWNFPDHDNDFGLTLAVWGVRSGPYLFLPVLGPSDPRDGIGYGANSALDPLTWVSFGGSTTLGWSRFGTGALDGRAHYLSATDTIKKTALDPYATYRSLYEQNRSNAVEAAKADLPATTPSWFGGSSTPTPAQGGDKATVAPSAAPTPSTLP